MQQFDNRPSVEVIENTAEFLQSLHEVHPVSLQIRREDEVSTVNLPWERMTEARNLIADIAVNFEHIPRSARPLTISFDASGLSFNFAGLPVDPENLEMALDSFATVDMAIGDREIDVETSGYFVAPRAEGSIPDMRQVATAASPTEAMMLYIASKVDLGDVYSISPDFDPDMESLEMRSLHDWKKYDVDALFQDACALLEPHIGWKTIYSISTDMDM